MTMRAEFNPLIKPYLVLTIGFTMVVSILFLPLALLWFLGVGQWWARHYYAKLECELTEKHLRFRKGILMQVEKTIPLENIQDVTFVEGPILKRFNLSTIKFETAGNAVGQAHAMELTGIVDAHDFRAAIFARRDALKAAHAAGVPQAGGREDAQLEALRAIQKSLDELLSIARTKA